MRPRPGRVNGSPVPADTGCVERHPELTRGQRRLLDAYRRWGPTAIILVITGVSLFLSVTVTATVMAIQRAPFADWVVAMSESVVIPLIVAPLASGLTVRLAGTIVVAHDRMEVMATTDPLTGLANRRRFFAAAEGMLADRPGGEVVLVAVTDMDGFKGVNDTHGHATGDAVLQQLGRQLSAAVGGHGMPARFGGDEFACILRVPRDAADAVRATVSRACRDIALGDELRLSASVGFAEVDGPQDIDAALSRADVALYLAKSAHRERMAA